MSSHRPSPEELTAASYRKSTYSGANNECVEIAEVGDWVGVRDSKDPAGPVLSFPIDSFAAFIADVSGGRFTS
jgi:hypothetical protein